MAISPSNNLLAALSQLQTGPRPSAPAARPAQQAAGGSAPVRNSFAAQLSSPATAIQTAAPERRQAFATAPAAQPQNQPPIPTRGGYLGQYVNVVV